MLSITLDTSALEAFFSLFSSVRRGVSPSSEAIRALVALPVMRHLVDHYNLPMGSDAGMSSADLADVLAHVGSKTYDGHGPFLSSLHRRYREDCARLDAFSRAFAVLDTGGLPAEVEARVTPYVPAGADLACTVYLLCTGHSGGYFHGDGISLDWGYVHESSDTLAATIAHEVHHLVYNGIVSGMAPVDAPCSLAFEVLTGLVGEGIAYACVGGVPSEGERGYDEFISYAAREKEHCQTISTCFEDIATGAMASVEDLYAWASTHMRSTFGAINYTGYRMMRAIDAAGGARAVVACITDPWRTIDAYHAACDALGDDTAPRFSDEAAAYLRGCGVASSGR